MTRPILILCETCQSEGRLLTSDGGTDDTDHGRCPDCEGHGDLLVECEPITLEDLCECGGDPDQPIDHHDISCPAAIE